MKATVYNISSSIVRKFLSVILGIILIPIYIRFLGVEAYGLVGLYATIIGSLALFDLGMSSTLNRELARLTALGQPGIFARNLTYSLEIIYWGISIILGITIILLSPLIAKHWINSDRLSLEQVQDAVLLMGGIFVIEWPISLYTGALFGLQKQVQFNVVSASVSILKNVVVIFILIYVSPTIKAFFLWQMCMSLLSAILLRYLLWRYLPSSKERLQFSILEIRKIWRYAAGVTAISVSTFCLTRIDKIILSKLLSLENFGYYTLAWNVASSISILTGAITQSLFPRLAGIVVQKRNKEIVNTYHRFYRFVATTVIPISLLLCFFCKEILFFWTKNVQLTENVYLAVIILTAGSICNSMMNIPYFLMLAYGWTRFTIYQNIIASIVFTPLLFWMAGQYGLIGATIVWLAINVAFIAISLPLMHRKLLKGELSKVYFQDIGIPLLISALVIGLLKILIERLNLSLDVQIIALIFCLAIVYMVLVFFNKEYWMYCRRILRNVFYKTSRYAE